VKAVRPSILFKFNLLFLHNIYFLLFVNFFVMVATIAPVNVTIKQIIVVDIMINCPIVCEMPSGEGITVKSKSTKSRATPDNEYKNIIF